MFIRSVVSVAALVGLTACGGGGGTLGGPSPEFLALDQAYDNLFLSVPTGSGLPSGNATYSGVILLASELQPGSASNAGYLGEASATWTLATGDFEGEATNFFYVSIDTATGRPNGIRTNFSPDGAVVSTNVEFDDLNVVAAGFTPTFGGTINGLAIAGTGDGLFRDTDGGFVTIFEDDPTSNVTLGGVATDVTILLD